jgi:hypothetical protein
VLLLLRRQLMTGPLLQLLALAAVQEGAGGALPPCPDRLARPQLVLLVLQILQQTLALVWQLQQQGPIGAGARSGQGPREVMGLELLTRSSGHSLVQAAVSPEVYGTAVSQLALLYVLHGMDTNCNICNI